MSVVLYVQDRDQFVFTIAELAESFSKRICAKLPAERTLHSQIQDGFEAHALMVGMRAVGAIAWRPANLSREVATAVSAQVGIALTRATAIEASCAHGSLARRRTAPRRAHRFADARAADTAHLDPCGSHNVDAGRGPRRCDRAGNLPLIVDEESAHLDALIGEAVEMAELDANVLKVQPEPRHTRTLLEHAVEESHTALGRHQVILMVQEPDRPAWFDAKLLSRVFRHLIENAALLFAAGKPHSAAQPARRGSTGI